MARSDGNMNRIGRCSRRKGDAPRQAPGELSTSGRDVEKRQVRKNYGSPLDRL